MVKTKETSYAQKETVFVVHGRNNDIRESMFVFLQSIGLHPLEWSEIVSKTGQGSPYVGDVLNKGFAISQAAVVIMTPDDEAKLITELQGSDEPNYEKNLTRQPRQNVLYEAGMAMGSYPDRTIIVEIGKLRPFSDVIGRHVVRLNNDTEKRQELAQRLETAGCNVNLAGTRWHKTGDFKLKENQNRSVTNEGNTQSVSMPKDRLSEFCEVTIDEIENVIIENGENKLEIVTELEGADAKKQFTGTLCILITNELRNGETYTSSKELKEILKSAGVGSLPNFASNMKKHKGVFRKSGKAQNVMYGLTTTSGRQMAKDIMKKLIQGES